jgi:hypothetical protein
MYRLASLLIVVFVVGACSGAAVGTVEPARTVTPMASADATASAQDAAPSSNPTATPTSPATPTPEPSNADAGPKTFAPGDTITVTSNGDDWATIVVSKVAYKKSYKGTYYTDTPKTKGDVFVQLFVTYTALTDGVDYNQFDWQVFADGVAIDDFTFVTNGPEPTLASGTLPKGRKAQGWLVYEVPAKGEVLLSYQANMFSDEGPVFEVKLR